MSERVKAFRGINGLRPTRWAGPLHLFHGALTFFRPDTKKASLARPHAISGVAERRPAVANGSAPGLGCAGDGFGAAVCAPLQ